MRAIVTAGRALMRGGGLPIVALVMLAIGIGAATVIFSIAQAVLLAPLPFADPERLVMLWGRDESRGPAVVELSLDDLRAWREQTTTMSAIEIFGSVNWDYRVTAPGEPFSAVYTAVSGSFFETLGARAMLGRTLNPSDDTPGAAAAVVLSAELWRRRFSADLAIVGRSITVGEGASAQPYEVVGVMAPEFQFPAGAELWSAAVRDLAEAGKRNKTDLPTNVRVFYGIGRLAEGQTIERAREDVSTIARRVELDSGQKDSRASAVVTPLVAYFFGSARPAVLAIGAAVAMLLLIAAANAAVLLLVQGIARQREVAIRLALGATRLQIVRLFLIESLVLVCVAGALGVAGAMLSFDTVVALAPGDVPRLDRAAIDGTALFWALGLCVVTAVLVGVVPAWQVSGAAVSDALSRRSQAVSAAPRARRARQALIVVQLAASVVLLVGAGLLGKSFLALSRADLGFDPQNVLTFDVYMPSSSGDTPEKRRAVVDGVIAEMRRLPGAIAAGAIYQRPFEHGPIGMDSSVIVEGQALADESAARNPIVNWESVTPDYFRAMEIGIVGGRAFDERDGERAPKVVILSQVTARRLWPDSDALGKRLLAYGSTEGGDPDWLTVVGIVEDARYREVQAHRHDLYLPYRQAPSGVKHYVVRTSGDPIAALPALTQGLRRIYPLLTIENATTMERIVDRTIAPWWFSSVVFAGMSLTALTFAAAGVFAVVAFAVRQRTREIGIRIALGARAGDVVALLLRDGALLAMVGLAIGVPSAWALTRFLSSLLVEVTPTDVRTFVSAVALLVVVCLLATYLPARWAAAVDPVSALKSDG